MTPSVTSVESSEQFGVFANPVTPFMTHSGLSLRFQVPGLIIKYRMEGNKTAKNNKKPEEIPSPQYPALTDSPACCGVKPLFSRSL